MENENSVSSEKCVCIYMFCVCFSRKALHRRPVSCNGKWSSTFFSLPTNPFLFLFIFRSVLFSFSHATVVSRLSRSRGFFFFLVNIDRRRRHGFRLRVDTHQATSTLPRGAKEPKGSALRCHTKRHPGDRSNGLYVMDFRASAWSIISQTRREHTHAHVMCVWVRVWVYFVV